MITIPPIRRRLAVALVLGAGALAGCGSGGSNDDPASLERLDALNSRIEALEERVAELQDAADATDPEAEEEG